MASSSYPLSARLSHLLLILLGIVALSSAAALVTRAPPDHIDPDNCQWPLVLCPRACCGADQACNPRNGLCKPGAPNPALGNIWLSSWYPAPVCSGSTCSTTSDDGYPRFEVHGSGFNGGSVEVVIYRGAVRSDRVWAGTVGGPAFSVRAEVVDCRGFGQVSYVQAFDLGSGKWSNKVEVWTGCKTW